MICFERKVTYRFSKFANWILTFNLHGGFNQSFLGLWFNVSMHCMTKPLSQHWKSQNILFYFSLSFCMFSCLEKRVKGLNRHAFLNERKLYYTIRIFLKESWNPLLIKDNLRMMKSFKNTLTVYGMLKQHT